MPSFTHEALVMLFRNRPQLAAELLQTLNIELPEFETVEVQEADLNQIVPTEYRADLVLLLQDGEPVFGIVLEVQLGRDEGKRWSWPLYNMALRARWRCRTCVLVVCTDVHIARWASQAIDTGPCAEYRPVVLGPEAVPRITDVDQATAAPELAVLSAQAHKNRRDGLAVVMATIAAVANLDPEQAGLYADFILVGLNEAARQALENLMAQQGYQYQSEFAREYFGKGKAEGREEGRLQGRAETVIKMMVLRGLQPTEEQRAHVAACQDAAQLDLWTERVLSAQTADEVLAP